ncbi:MAG TPA: hypothetical protein VG028_16795 [Terriglobia bacterium]|nr:hypothetical protein [Terriglobia bacterium]
MRQISIRSLKRAIPYLQWIAWRQTHLRAGAWGCKFLRRRDGFTIAVSQARQIAPIARRTVLSDDALSVPVPILEEIVGWDTARIRTFFEAQGLLIQEGDRVRADWLTIASNILQPAAAPVHKEELTHAVNS